MLFPVFCWKASRRPPAPYPHNVPDIQDQLFHLFPKGKSYEVPGSHLLAVHQRCTVSSRIVPSPDRGISWNANASRIYMFLILFQTTHIPGQYRGHDWVPLLHPRDSNWKSLCRMQKSLRFAFLYLLHFPAQKHTNQKEMECVQKTSQTPAKDPDRINAAVLQAKACHPRADALLPPKKKPPPHHRQAFFLRHLGRSIRFFLQALLSLY